MRFHYRIENGSVEIVRCFGRDPHIVIPEKIEGRDVTRTAAYAFSSRKEKEEEGVLIFESGGLQTVREEERLLAGEDVVSVSFPDTMEQIGRYVFYGCRNLKDLAFSDRLRDIGSGAFTGCSSLEKLEVRMREGSRSCVPEILGDLWQRIDVSFLWGDEEARLVFPQHYEEAVENTPARILFTQHHGSGNNYRQCFYNREVDYRKYDALFSVAKVHDKTEVLTDLVFARLMYPAGLTGAAGQEYEDYIRQHQPEVLEHLVQTENMDALREISRRNLWQESALEAALEYAASEGKTEILGFLMNEKHERFPVKKTKYTL